MVNSATAKRRDYLNIKFQKCFRVFEVNNYNGT